MTFRPDFARDVRHTCDGDAHWWARLNDGREQCVECRVIKTVPKCTDCNNALVLVVKAERFWGCAVSKISSPKAEHARSPGTVCGPAGAQWEPRTWWYDDAALKEWGL